MTTACIHPLETSSARLAESFMMFSSSAHTSMHATAQTRQIRALGTVVSCFPISGFDRQLPRRSDYNNTSESYTRDITVRLFLLLQAKR